MHGVRSKTLGTRLWMLYRSPRQRASKTGPLNFRSTSISRSKPAAKLRTETKAAIPRTCCLFLPRPRPCLLLRWDIEDTLRGRSWTDKVVWALEQFVVPDQLQHEPIRRRSESMSRTQFDRIGRVHRVVGHREQALRLLRPGIEPAQCPQVAIVLQGERPLVGGVVGNALCRRKVHCAKTPEVRIEDRVQDQVPRAFVPPADRADLECRARAFPAERVVAEFHIHAIKEFALQ